MSESRILLASPRSQEFSPDERPAYLREALAEDVFARLNHEGLITNDGKKPTCETPLGTSFPLCARQAVSAYLKKAGIVKPPKTFGDLFNGVVAFVDGRPRINYKLLLATGILAKNTTLTRLREILQFGDLTQGDVTKGNRPTVGDVAFAAPTTIPPRSRPVGWATLGVAAPTIGNPPQPAKSGWYLGVRPTKAWKAIPVAVGTHSAFGYFDAKTKKWGPTSGMRPEYAPGAKIPYPVFSSEPQLDGSMPGLQFLPVEMGPAAKDKGLTPEQFHDAMVRDLIVFEAHYRALARVDSPRRSIFYTSGPNWTHKKIDGNCNTYCHYLISCLGINAPYPRGFATFGTMGQEVITRDANGDVYITADKDAAAITGNANVSNARMCKALEPPAKKTK